MSVYTNQVKPIGHVYLYSLPSQKLFFVRDNSYLRQFTVCTYEVCLVNSHCLYETTPNVKAIVCLYLLSPPS